MLEFIVSIHSFQEVREFVELASVQPFRILVENQATQVNGKSYMGMFSLDFRQPLRVLADCSKQDEEAFQEFYSAVRHLVGEH